MNWIRVSVGIATDPRVYALAEDLDVRPAEVVGLLVGVMAALPGHAPTADLSNVPSTLLERWAGWEGVRGQFAARFAARFLNDGVWAAWEKYNGSAMREAKSAAERAKAARNARKGGSSPHGSPHGMENGTANGSPLRDETRRSTTTTTTAPSSEKPDERGAGAGIPDPTPLPKPVVAGSNWVADACALWAESVSVMPYGMMGKRLAPLVAQYGEDLVLVALKIFLEWRKRRAGEEKVPGLPHFLREFSAFVPMNRQHELRPQSMAVVA